MLKRGKMDRDVVEIVGIDSLVPKEHLLRKIDKAVDFNHASASNDAHAILFHSCSISFLGEKSGEKRGAKKKPVENRLPISYNRNAAPGPVAWELLSQ